MTVSVLPKVVEAIGSELSIEGGVLDAVPMAEAVRWQIREGELIQVIGRARGVNRTADNPVDVLVMTDVALPFAVEPLEAADLEPSPANMMMARTGVALESPTHAAVIYPSLWRSADAAKKAFQRHQTGTNPYDSMFIGECPPLLSQWTYQLTGERQRPAIAWCDLSRVPDPEAWLTARLGPLAKCHLMP